MVDRIRGETQPKEIKKIREAAMEGKRRLTAVTQGRVFAPIKKALGRRNTLALVLSGGGARGALQVGALHALLERGILPDMIVGTSAGALNAGVLAVYGLSLEGVAQLEGAWREAATMTLLPSDSWWALMRSLFRRNRKARQERLREFLVEHGIHPDLRFRDIDGVRVGMVAADLNDLSMIVYGEQPDDLVLEGILASTAIVPWMPPLEVGGHQLIDGGIVSNVPILVAMRWGATHVLAIDVADERVLESPQQGVTLFMTRLLYLVSNHETALERALAEQHGVHVWYINLRAPTPVPIWDFTHTDELIHHGYNFMRRWLDEHPINRT